MPTEAESAGGRPAEDPASAQAGSRYSKGWNNFSWGAGGASAAAASGEVSHDDVLDGTAGPGHK